MNGGMRLASARQTALRALERVEQDGAYSGLVLHELLEKAALAPRDAAFATALFYGVIERLLTLDDMIRPHSKTPLKKQDVTVRNILRMGAYQLAYMDSVPDSAAVNESVLLCKKNKKTSAAGFVNAVLRALLRAGKTLTLSGAPNDSARMSIEFSTPLPLVVMLTRRFGAPRARGILEKSIGAAPLYARVNTVCTTTQSLIARLADEGVTACAHEEIPDCISLYQAGDITRLSAFSEGLFHIQDASSQLCALAVDARKGMTVLDLCAAPGGKSFTIAEGMQNMGTLLSFDLYDFKAGLIRQGAERLGLSVIQARVGDAAQYNPALPAADRVLCDAPCSGYGVMRRKPEIKYKPLDSFEELQATQTALLGNAARYVRDGGVLIYSTCTLRREENEAVADAFLQDNSAFAPRPLPDNLQGCLHEGEHMATILPDDFDSDGFFIASFIKTGASQVNDR
ncbi:MAG: 16S rRNA (cytosine(967)-C(5))-methyltransferase RsmB [Acetanaerobacterium sp.]